MLQAGLKIQTDLHKQSNINPYFVFLYQAKEFIQSCFNMNGMMFSIWFLHSFVKELLFIMITVYLLQKSHMKCVQNKSDQP